MALVCFKCSAENADGALVCRHCGAALPPPSWGRSLLPEDDQFDPLSAPTLVMQHTAPAPLPPIEETAVPMPERKSGRTLLLGLATGMLIVAAGAWLLRPGDVVPSTAAPDGTDTAASAAAATAPAAPTHAASQAPAAASTPLPPAVAEIASRPVAAVAAVASAAPASPGASTAQAAAPASAADTRKRIPAPVARKRALSSVPAAAPPASVGSPLPAAAAEPAVSPPAAPARPKTVSELCAGGNLITRGFCEQRECRRSELAADPLCMKLKDAEQRRLFQQ